MVSAVPRSPNWQTGQPVPEHTMLGGRCSPQISKLADWTTSPRAYRVRWSVQSLDLQTGRSDDQSLSIPCSVVSAVPRSPNWLTGRPVPEHTVLDGRCSPQISKLADCTTSPRAYHARWSVQSPGTLIFHQFLSLILKKASCHIN